MTLRSNAQAVNKLEPKSKTKNEAHVGRPWQKNLVNNDGNGEDSDGQQG